MRVLQIAVGVVGLIHQPVQVRQDVAGVLGNEPETGMALPDAVALDAQRAELADDHGGSGEALEHIALEHRVVQKRKGCGSVWLAGWPGTARRGLPGGWFAGCSPLRRGWLRIAVRSGYRDRDLREAQRHVMAAVGTLAGTSMMTRMFEALTGGESAAHDP